MWLYNDWLDCVSFGLMQDVANNAWVRELSEYSWTSVHDWCSNWWQCLWCQFSRELISKVSWTVSHITSFINKSDEFIKNDFQTLHSRNQLVNVSLAPTLLAQTGNRWLPVPTATNTWALTWECCGSCVLTAPSVNVLICHRILTENLDYTFLSSLFHCCWTNKALWKHLSYQCCVSFVFYLILWFFEAVSGYTQHNCGN